MTSFPNYPTFHCHPSSLDSGSTPEAFADRELQLGTSTVTVTDHGNMGACRQVYDIAIAKGLTPVLGLEGYLRDDNCPILLEAGVQRDDKGTLAAYAKYFHVTVHYLDYEAYLCGVRLLSKADERAERHGSERKPLFTWANLEELGSHNVTVGSGCLIGACQRHILDHGNLPLALKYYEKLRSVVKPGNFYVELFPHDCSQNWVSGVFITVRQPDGTERKHKWHFKKRLRTNKGEIFAENLAEGWNQGRREHFELQAVKNYSEWQELEPAALVSVESVEGFKENECTSWAPTGDVQAGTNRVMKAFAHRYGDKVIISDDSHYSVSEEAVVQNVRLSQSGNWRFFGDYSRQDSATSYEYFRTRMDITESEFQGWVENNIEWAARFKDFKFDSKTELPTKFYEPLYCDHAWHQNPKIPVRDHSLMYCMELVKNHARMDWNNIVYVERLQTEIKLLHNNGTIDLLPYFMLAEEVCEVYEKAGLLVGPGRGSAAGVLLTYLLGITHVDPIRYKLSLERFLTLDRIKGGKLPDIDLDFGQREILTDHETGWLRKRFGDHYAQISVDTTLKVRMAAQDVARFRRGFLPPEVVALTKRFETPPQGVADIDFVLGYDTDEGHVQGSIETDPALKQYIKQFPDDWAIVQKCLGLGRGKGRHASAFVVANRPVHEFIPLTTVSDVRVTSYTAPSVEAVGGLKMDFLVVSCLQDINDCLALILMRNQAGAIAGDRRIPVHRLVPFEGKLLDVWDLPPDPAVFADIATGKTETVFQFSTPGAVQWLEHFAKQRPDGTYPIDSIESMAAFTALDRPGPLDMFVADPVDNSKKHNMLEEYARRARGEPGSPDVLPIFEQLLPETYGILIFQEQVQRVYQDLTGCTGTEAEEFRSDVAKKKKAKIEKAYTPFIEKASLKLGSANAEAAWKFFITFAAYGFNYSHSVCYSTIAYACAFLKHHFTLEWWTSVLKNATKNEINEKLWKHCGSLINLPDVALSGPNFEIRGDRIQAPLSFLHGIGAAAQAQLIKYAPYTDIDDFCRKIQKHKEDTKFLARRVPTEDGAGSWVPCTPGERAADGEVAWRPGHNALHRGVVTALIVSDAMKSLFPSNDELATVYDSLAEFERASADAAYVPAFTKTGKLRKRPKPAAVDPSFINMSAFLKYQLKKSILPAYTEDLVPLLLTLQVPNVGVDADGMQYFDWTPPHGDSRQLGFATSIDMERLERPDRDFDSAVIFPAAAYIESTRPFTYGKDGRQREACEVVFDVEGGRFKMVKWGGMKETIPDMYKQKLEGAIVVAILCKYSGDRPIVIEDLILVSPPLEKEIK